jgi:hypothetical protein
LAHTVKKRGGGQGVIRNKPNHGQEPRLDPRDRFRPPPGCFPVWESSPLLACSKSYLLHSGDWGYSGPENPNNP